MVVLQTIELVVKSRIDDISYPKIKNVIQLASDEMTKSKVIFTAYSIVKMRLLSKCLTVNILVMWLVTSKLANYFCQKDLYYPINIYYVREVFYTYKYFHLHRTLSQNGSKQPVIFWLPWATNISMTLWRRFSASSSQEFCRTSLWSKH